MKKVLLIAIIFFAAIYMPGQQFPYQNPELSSGERARDLISRLTLEEKASFMCDQSDAVPRLTLRWFIAFSVLFQMKPAPNITRQLQRDWITGDFYHAAAKAVTISSQDWEKYTASLTSTAGYDNASLVILIKTEGKLANDC